MTYGIGTPDVLVPFYRGRLFRKVLSQTVPGAAALAFGGVVGAWILYARPASAPSVDQAPTVAPAIARAGARAVGAPVLTPLRRARRAVASNPYGALPDPTFSLGFTPLPLGKSAPLGANFEANPPPPSAAIAETEEAPLMPAVPPTDQSVPLPAPRPSEIGSAEVESVPLPTPRPPELGLPAGHGRLHASSRRLAMQNVTNARPTTASDHRTFFQKLFGMPQASGPALAYASAEDGFFGNTRRVTSGPPYDRWTAVYDIAAHTVYMPDGTRLEAHSGLGDRIDDPRHVSEKMRGATPPDVYELQPREQLFHGVRALRLIPIGGGNVFGRTGLLAHTYMLGPNGQSNGCVSFKNYRAFLQAFTNGEVKRLVVVARLN